MDVNQKMLFEYALHKDSNKVVHVDSVSNGKRCNCVCKNCGDSLIAKNNGKIIQHHFSHTTKEESRDCQMTQLHIAMQLHFASLPEISLPRNEIEIDEEVLIVPELTTSVRESALEYRIGPYLADVYLITNTSEIVIEVCVTHKCEEEKRLYYIEHKVDSIEYNFPLSEDNNIAEWISLLRNNLVEYEWIYHSDLEIKKLKHADEIELKKKKEKAERKNRTLRLVNNVISTKKIDLPCIYEEMEYIFRGILYKETRVISPERNITCDDVSLCYDTDDYVVIEGFLGNRVISIIYSFSEYIPELTYLDDRGVLCNCYTEEFNTPSWTWIKHPTITKKFEKAYLQFKSDCQNIYHKRQSLIYLKNKVNRLSVDYLANQQGYFDRDYRKWKRWMINKGLFTPTPDKRSPSYPYILKMKREYPMLWPFQTWHIMILSYLAEIIDTYPVAQKIYHKDIFLALEEKYGLSHEYRYLLKEFEDLNESTTFDNLIRQDCIIQDALSPYAMMSIISIRNDHLIRKGALMLSLRI
ncbi:competence protein CoiA family protein [Klebsiella pneumoniae]